VRLLQLQTHTSEGADNRERSYCIQVKKTIIFDYYQSNSITGNHYQSYRLKIGINDAFWSVIKYDDGLEAPIWDSSLKRRVSKNGWEQKLRTKKEASASRQDQQQAKN
jgi:hypothetical protein